MSEEPSLKDLLELIVKHQQQLDEEIKRIYAILKRVANLAVEARELLAFRVEICERREVNYVS